jgi:hypothetical protein
VPLEDHIRGDRDFDASLPESAGAVAPDQRIDEAPGVEAQMRDRGADVGDLKLWRGGGLQIMACETRV